MSENKGAQILAVDIRQAVADIKEAILQGQYEAAKGVNRIQLAVYFGIGKYISLRTRKGVWGTGALDAISNQLRRELPGLRGYSASSLKNMRKFYENWDVLDANSSVATNETKTTIAIAEINSDKLSAETGGNSTIAIAELDKQQIDIFRTTRFNIKYLKRDEKINCYYHYDHCRH
jgi:hypothetical protein